MAATIYFDIDVDAVRVLAWPPSHSRIEVRADDVDLILDLADAEQLAADLLRVAGQQRAAAQAAEGVSGR